MLCFLEAIGIGEEGDAIVDLHEEVVIAVGTYVMILPEVQGMNQLSAVGALGPEVVGDRILLLFAATEFRLVKDTHGGSAKSLREPRERACYPRSTVRTTTFSAPPFSCKVRAHSSAVEPVVNTSSIRRTGCPRRD